MGPEEIDVERSSALGEVLGFMRLLWEVDHRLRSASKRLLTVAGVTGPQRLALRMVGRFPDASAGDLAELLHVHPSTLTGVLGRLERAGLLERRHDASDRRRSLFRLSPKGAKIDRMRAGTVEEAVEKTVTRLPSAKVNAARDVLAALSASLAGQGHASRTRAGGPSHAARKKRGAHLK